MRSKFLLLAGLILAGCGGGGSSNLGGPVLSPYRGLYSGAVFMNGGWQSTVVNITVTDTGIISGGAWQDGGIGGFIEPNGTAHISIADDGPGADVLVVGPIEGFSRVVGNDSSVSDGQPPTEKVRLHLEALF